MKSDFYSRGKLIILSTLLLFSGLSFAAEEALEPTWVRPGTDFTKYHKFLLKPLNLNDVRIERPPWAVDDPIEWKLETMDKESIQAIFRESMKEGLEANGGYPVVYTAAEDVLEVDVELLTIMPYVRPGSDSKSGGHQIITLGSGEITGAAELRDSTSRSLLLLIEGERVVGQEYKEFSAENNVANLRGMFRAFAKRLRVALDKAHAK